MVTANHLLVTYCRESKDHSGIVKMQNGFEPTVNLPYQQINYQPIKQVAIKRRLAVFMSSEWCALVVV